MQQDPRSFLLQALLQGMAAASQGIVTDAYTMLKNRIQTRFKNDRNAQKTFDQFQQNPDANYGAMGNALEKTGVTSDAQALGAAYTIINNINAPNSQFALGNGKVKVIKPKNSYWPIIILGVCEIIGCILIAFIFFPGFFRSFQTQNTVSLSSPAVAVKKINPTPTIQVTPTASIDDASSTMEAFCLYLGSDNTRMAYDITTSTYQHHHSFTNDFSPKFSNASNPGVPKGGCQTDSATKSQGIVTAHFSFTQEDQNFNIGPTINYIATLVPSSQIKGWKIDNIVQVN